MYLYHACLYRKDQSDKQYSGVRL